MTTENNQTDRWEGLREVLTMAWPIILGSLSFTVMMFVDSLMVSWLGVDALAAVGSAGIWAYTLGVFVFGIAGCVSTFASQSLGKGDTENCSSFAWQGIYISFAGGVLAILIWPMADNLFGIMGHTPEVTRLEVVYFRVRLLGYVFIAWQGALTGFFLGVNRPKIPMYTAIAANTINVALNYCLIFGKFGFPKWGIAGAAAATVISLGIQVLLLQAVFLSDGMHSQFNTRRTYRFNWTKAADLFRIGWPSGLSSFLDIASWSIFTSILVGRFGTTQLAAHAAAIQFMHLSFMPAMGLGQAVTPIVGQRIGRGQIAVAKARAYLGMRIAIVYMVTVGTIVAVFGYDLIGVFSDDPEVRSLGHILLIIAAVFNGFDGVNIVTSGALRGAGDTRYMMWAFVIGSWFVALPLAWLFSTPLGFGAPGAWMGMTFYIIGLSGVLFVRFRGERWRNIRIFSEDRIPAAIEPSPEEIEQGDLSSP